MANRFYIPRERDNAAANLLGAAALATRLYGIKQQRAMHAGDIDVARERNRIADERTGIDEETNRIRRDELEQTIRGLDIQQRKEKPSEMQFTEHNVANLKYMIAQRAQSQGLDDKQINELFKAWEPLTTWLEKQAADGKGTRGAVYAYLKNPNNRKVLVGAVVKNMRALQDKLIKEGGSPEQIDYLSDRVQALLDDTDGSAVDAAFPAVARERMMEEATLATKLKDQWSEPYTDQYGNRVQKNLVTGQEKKITGMPTGMEITTGDTTIRTGVPTTPGGMQRRTAGTLEDKLLKVRNDRARASEIIRNYKSQYLEFQEKIKNLQSSLKLKFKGTKIPFTDLTIDDLIDMDVSPEDQQQLADYQEFRSTAWEAVNAKLYELSGAQINNAEFKRQLEVLPNPGKGLFDGDDPVTFGRKLERFYENAVLWDARYLYYLKNGLMTHEQMERAAKQNLLPNIDTFKQRIQQRGNELEYQGMDANTIRRTIKQEFFLP